MNLKRFFVLFLLFCFAAPLNTLAQDKKPVDSQVLLRFILIEIENYKKTGDPLTNSFKMGEMEIVQAMQEYTSGGKKIKIMLIDSLGFLPFLMPFQMVLQSEMETENEYIKKLVVGGQPGAEKYDFNKKVAEFIVLIAGRFLLHITADNVEAKAVNDYKAITELINIAGIADLAKK